MSVSVINTSNTLRVFLLSVSLFQSSGVGEVDSWRVLYAHIYLLQTTCIQVFSDNICSFTKIAVYLIGHFVINFKFQFSIEGFVPCPVKWLAFKNR